jgi:hypothetical protein
MDHAFYFETLYPFQDRVLQVLNGLETGLYLGGGTAASRGYGRISDFGAVVRVRLWDMLLTV